MSDGWFVLFLMFKRHIASPGTDLILPLRCMFSASLYIKYITVELKKKPVSIGDVIYISNLRTVFVSNM